MDLISTMANSELPDVESLNLANWNISPVEYLSTAFGSGDDLWPTPPDLPMQQYLATDGSISFQMFPSTDFSGSRPSHVAEATWSLEIPMAMTLPAPIMNMQTCNYSPRMPVNSFQPNVSGLQSSSRKRQPKAATMTDQRWEPAIERIRHFRFVEKMPINEIRDSVNKEFGFNATEKQYKDKIEKMGLRKNCTAEQRKRIIRHISYRKDRLGKESKLVRVWGTTVSVAKIDRWKEQGPVKSLRLERSYERSPSPLPSEISIQTTSRLSSLTNELRALNGNFWSKTRNSIASRLLDVAQQSNEVISAQQARSVFNDIQQLLETRNNPLGTVGKNGSDYKWDPRMETNWVWFRNLMNLQSTLMVGSGSNSLSPNSIVNSCQQQCIKLTRRDMQFATWNTPYGPLELSFWTNAPVSAGENGTRTIDQSPSTSCAKIALYTKSSTNASIRLNFELSAANSIPIKLTYQAMVPNDSEVWKIVQVGDVEALKKALEMKTASLTDRNEEGRSLLSHAVTKARVDMCKFLLEHGADPNAMEYEEFGFLLPIHNHFRVNDHEDCPENLGNKKLCWKAMLESDADPSIEHPGGHDLASISGYYHTLRAASYATFETVLLFGKPFITLDTMVSDRKVSPKIPPLICLAENCRYYFSDVFEVMEKVLLLLRLGADFKCLDNKGNNILHCILKARSWYDEGGITSNEAETMMMYICDCDPCNAGFREPGQFLKAAISKGVDIYAINNYGETPTMTAEKCGWYKEWAKALEECGIDANEVRLHTKAWESVCDEMERELLDCDIEGYDAYLELYVKEVGKAFEDFNSRYWKSGNFPQKPTLSFEEFCNQWDLRRRQKVDCVLKWSQVQNEVSWEFPPSEIEEEVSHFYDELKLKLHPIARPPTPNQPLNDVMQSHYHPGAFQSGDNSALTPGNYANVIAENAEINYTNIDMTNADLGGDLFDCEAYDMDMGVPVMSTDEFMDLDMPDVSLDDEALWFGGPRVEEVFENTDNSEFWQTGQWNAE